MAVPTFLATVFRYLSVAGVTDVAAIITNFRSEVITNGTWTEPSAGLFKSPPDADGRFFDILLVATTATRLQFRVRNQSATVLFDREIDIDGAGTEVRIYTGPYHAWIESVRATPEVAFGTLLDLTPDLQTAHSNYVAGNAKRTSAGADDGNFGNIGQVASFDAGVPAFASRLMTMDQAGGVVVPKLTPSGDQIAYPAELAANMSGLQRMIGRLFQAYMVDASLAFGAEVTFPIDTATSAVFKVISVTSSGGGTQRIAVRKA